MYAAWQNPNEAFKAMLNPMTYFNMGADMISWAGNLGNSLYEGDWSAVAYAGGELLGLGAATFARGGGSQMAMSLAKDTARLANQGLAWARTKLSDAGSRAMDILGDTSGRVRMPFSQADSTIGKAFDPSGGNVQIDINPKTLIPTKDISALNPMRQQTAMLYAGNRAIIVDKTGRVLDGHHRLLDAIQNRRAVDVQIGY